MSRKSFHNEDDATQIEYLDAGDYGGGSEMVTFDPTYKPIEVEKIEQELTVKSKEVVSEIVKVYFETGEISKPEYVQTLEQIETMNLESMLVQVKYADHMIQSLMRRLNETGTIDSSLFRLIMEAQNHALSLTLQVSQYVRNLPNYFKSLKFELLPQLPSIIPGQYDEQAQIGNVSDPIDDEGFINRPQMGTRDLLRYIEETEENAKKREQELEEMDPTSYIPTNPVKPIVDNTVDILNDNKELAQPSGMESVPPPSSQQGL